MALHQQGCQSVRLIGEVDDGVLGEAGVLRSLGTGGPERTDGEHEGRPGRGDLLGDVLGGAEGTDGGDGRPGTHDPVEGHDEGQGVRGVERHDIANAESAVGQCSGEGVHPVAEFTVGGHRSGGRVRDGDPTFFFGGQPGEQHVIDTDLGNLDGAVGTGDWHRGSSGVGHGWRVSVLKRD